MKALKVSPTEYADYFPAPFHCYNKAAFNELNSHKADALHYIVFHDGKIRLGIIFGQRENTLFSPFSAPYGGFSFLSSKTGLTHIQEAVSSLDGYAGERGLSGIQISLPPCFYAHDFLAKTASVLNGGGYRLQYFDITHFFDTEDLVRYQKVAKYSAVKQLKSAQRAGLHFQPVGTPSGRRACYRIVEQSKEERGLPKRLSFEAVSDTLKFVSGDFFSVSLKDKIIAAAAVYLTAPGIAQGVAWGFLPEFSQYRPVNFLAFNLFKHCHSLGLRYVDLGISTECGRETPGLFYFKEGLGCRAAPKFTFFKTGSPG